MSRFLTEDDRQRYERVFGAQAAVDATLCFDCGARNPRKSTPVAGGRRYCDECWTWRKAHSVEFDERTREQLEAALHEDVLNRR